MKAVGNFFAVLCGVVLLNMVVASGALDLNQVFVQFVRFTGSLLTIGVSEPQPPQTQVPTIAPVDPSEQERF